MNIVTIRDIVKKAGQEFKANTAFQIRGEDGAFKKWSYPQAVAEIKQLMKAFMDLGLKPSDKIAILSENRPYWSISYLAVASYGAVAVPLDSLAETAILERVLAHSEAKCLIVSAKFREFVDNLKLDIKCINMDLLLNDGKCLAFTGLLKEEASWDDLEDLPEGSLAAILYTSGTTGDPKGVMLSHKNIVSNVTTVDTLFKLSSSDRLVSVLPLHHTFEASAGFLTPFLVGAMVTHSESLKSTKIVQNMKDTKLTILIGVPLLYQLFYEGIVREAEEKGPIVKIVFNSLFNLSRALNLIKINIGRYLFFFIHKKLGGHIRFWVAGGAAIDVDLLKDFEALGIRIYQGYGLTESSPVISACYPKANKFGSVGRPLPGVEVSIKDPDPSGTGEI
ncbi:AMP-binding protein, partial [Candidatus Margulisiibacteriota bacterium]